MEVVAVIFVAIVLIAFAVGISRLLLEGFFFMVNRSLSSSPEQERVDSNEALIKGVDRLAGLATQ